MSLTRSATASGSTSMPPSSQLVFSQDFLRRYLEIAPAALAIERSLECEILSSRPFERPILDIGCGDGVFASIISEQKIDTGIDFDQEEIDRARTYDRYSELITCGAANIPKPDASYRTIFSNSVMEHIPDLLPVLKEQHRLLAPGGHMYVTIPTDRWEQASIPYRLLAACRLHSAAKSYGRAYNSFWRHYHAHSEPQWIAMFHEAGFEVADQTTYAPPNLTTTLDFLSVVAAPAMVSKKLLGRWIALPALRRMFVSIAHGPVTRMVGKLGRGQPGNLVFFALVKKR